MAFNWPVFKTRARTALIFVAVMAAGLLTNHWLFLLLFSIIHWGCWIEYQALISRIRPEYQEIGPFHKYGVILAGQGMLLFATANYWNLGDVAVSAFGFWIILIMAFVLPVTELLFSRNINLGNIWRSLKGLIYISLSISLMIHLRSGEIWRMTDEDSIFFKINVSSAAYTGFLIPLIIIASIWINDTMAYLVGSFIGKTPLSKISPKKNLGGDHWGYHP